MRLYSRRAKGQSFTIEDLLTVIALVAFYRLVACNFVMIYLGGTGHHILTLQPFHIQQMSKAAYGVQTLFAVCLGFVKIGITLMLQRIFFVRSFKIAAWVTMGLCICWMLFTILIGIFICQPVAMNWDPAMPGGSCGDQNAVFAAVGFFDLATDLLIILLPIPMLWKLQLRWRHKVALYLIFGAGALTMIFGALRLRNVLTMDFSDATYSQVGGFSQMRSTHSDDDLELDALREKQHDVTVVAARRKRSDDGGAARAWKDDDASSGSEAGILVTNDTSVVREPGRAL